MNPKLTAKKFNDYLKTTRNKFNFQVKGSTGNPVSYYLQSCGYTNVGVDTEEITYTNKIGENVKSRTPRWAVNFLATYRTAPYKNRLAYAMKTLITQTSS
jgi:hypothetical protein